MLFPSPTRPSELHSFDRFRTSLRAPSIPDVGPPGVPLGDGRSLRRPESCSLCYAGSWLGSSEQFDGFGTDPGSRGGCALFFFLRGHGWCRCKYSSNSWLSDHLCVCVWMPTQKLTFRNCRVNTGSSMSIYWEMVMAVIGYVGSEEESPKQVSCGQLQVQVGGVIKVLLSCPIPPART